MATDFSNVLIAAGVTAFSVIGPLLVGAAIYAGLSFASRISKTVARFFDPPGFDD
jgi:hypothetical protein